MLLADLGADVIRIDRPPTNSGLVGLDRVTCRNRRSLALDLKNPVAIEILLTLVETADVLIEGLRPGVAERLGFGPEVCEGRNPGLVYGRMTGWGQEGPLRDTAGHDINYIALTGGLDAIGLAGGAPVPPLNLVGDYGGGALYLAVGVLSALVERGRSGRGQVIDSAMTDGSASLMTLFYELAALGMWTGGRGRNILDGGAPFYATYQTADDRYVAVGALEPQFYAELLNGLGLDPADLPGQYDQAGWPIMRERFAAVIASRSRDEWVEVFAGTDSCVAPVLSMTEAPSHAHNIARHAFVEVGGVTQPAPAPRFSRSASDSPGSAPDVGEHTDSVLSELGFDPEQVAEFRQVGAVQ
jgi:alpha-methylacyl-CoA racemase